MKIKALKSGTFAHPDPAERQLNVKEGETYDVDGQMAASLLNCGWGEVAPETPTEKPLNKMNKGELIAYAAKNNIELDPTATNADMVVAITWAEANRDDE